MCVREADKQGQRDRKTERRIRGEREKNVVLEKDRERKT